MSILLLSTTIAYADPDREDRLHYFRTDSWSIEQAEDAVTFRSHGYLIGGSNGPNIQAVIEDIVGPPDTCMYGDVVVPGCPDECELSPAGDIVIPECGSCFDSSRGDIVGPGPEGCGPTVDPTCFNFDIVGPSPCIDHGQTLRIEHFGFKQDASAQTVLSLNEYEAAGMTYGTFEVELTAEGWFFREKESE